MKRKQKLLMASIAAAAAVLMTAGVTLAAVSTESTFSGTISTPDLSISAKAVNVSVYSASSVDADGKEVYVKSDLLLSENQIGFSHGGSVTFSDKSITINNILPGDKVEFEIEITSKSTVAFDYRAELYVNSTQGQNLINQLDFDFEGFDFLRQPDDGNQTNNNLYPAVLTDYTEWETFSANQSAIKTVPVTISLPITATEGQGESIELFYVAGAVQHTKEQPEVAELDFGGEVKKFKSLAEAVLFAQNNDISEIRVVDSAVIEEGSVNISKAIKFTGVSASKDDKPIVRSARFIVKDGAAVTFENVAFVGKSYIDVSNCDALTVKNCRVDINAVRYFDTYSRSYLKDGAFIVSGSSLAPVQLTVEESVFMPNSGAAINMRSPLSDGSLIFSNRFGSADDGSYGGDAVISLFGAANRATVNIEENEIYGNLAMSFNGATGRFNVVSVNNTFSAATNKVVGGTAPAAFMDSGSTINSQSLKCENLDCASLLFGAVDVTFGNESAYRVAAGKVVLSDNLQESDFCLNFAASGRLATNAIVLYKNNAPYAYVNTTVDGEFVIEPING